MHHHCLSCSADLRSNDTVEAMPIGRRLAFDAWKGRLWVVCPSCRRWNLTPIEERWEPVEQLERLFRDCRMRVESENIGLARLPDGSTLVRIGQALPGELAAWRYGEELRRRRWKAALRIGSVLTVGIGVVTAGPMALASVGMPVALANLGFQALNWATMVRRRRRPIHRVPAEQSPRGATVLLRRLHLDGAVLSRSFDGSATLWLPLALETGRAAFSGGVAAQQITLQRLLRTPPLVLQGDAVGRVVGRALVLANHFGGSARQVSEALQRLDAAGGAEAFVRATARRDIALQRGYAWGTRNNGPLSRDLPYPIRRQLADGAPVLDKIDALALEMALNDEKERRAQEGELAQLEAEWREAEMLAGIADALPDEAG